MKINTPRGIRNTLMQENFPLISLRRISYRDRDAINNLRDSAGCPLAPEPVITPKRVYETRKTGQIEDQGVVSHLYKLASRIVNFVRYTLGGLTSFLMRLIGHDSDVISQTTPPAAEEIVRPLRRAQAQAQRMRAQNHFPTVSIPSLSADALDSARDRIRPSRSSPGFLSICTTHDERSTGMLDSLFGAASSAGVETIASIDYTSSWLLEYKTFLLAESKSKDAVRIVNADLPVQIQAALNNLSDPNNASQVRHALRFACNMDWVAWMNWAVWNLDTSKPPPDLHAVFFSAVVLGADEIWVSQASGGRVTAFTADRIIPLSVMHRVDEPTEAKRAADDANPNFIDAGKTRGILINAAASTSGLYRPKAQVSMLPTKTVEGGKLVMMSERAATILDDRTISSFLQQTNGLLSNEEQALTINEAVRAIDNRLTTAVVVIAIPRAGKSN